MSSAALSTATTTPTASPTTWFDWSAVDVDLLTFSRRLIGLRLSHPVFRRRRFLVGAEAEELLGSPRRGLR
jgi:pullulanase/glycogen debranching enzyme